MVGKLNTEQIEVMLKENVLGRIGCSDGKQIHVIPVNYVYDGKFIIAHSAEGMKTAIMRKNPNICFEIDEMKSFTEWKSVIVWGVYQELTNEWDRYHALQYLVERMMYIKINKTALRDELEQESGLQCYHPAKAIIYRIIIQEKKGRFETP